MDDDENALRATDNLNSPLPGRLAFHPSHLLHAGAVDAATAVGDRSAPFVVGPSRTLPPDLARRAVANDIREEVTVLRRVPLSDERGVAGQPVFRALG